MLSCIERSNIARTNGSKADPKKISATLKARGIVPPSRLGTKQSTETKTKRAAALRANWASGKRKIARKPVISPEGLARKIAATQAMRRRIAHNGKLTDIERIVDNYLHKNKVKHAHEYPVGRKCVDFYLTDYDVILEADSEYWHQDKEKDKLKDLYVSNLMPDTKIIRLPEKMIKSGDFIKLLIWGAKRGV